jgi:hypothetical protein
MSTNIYNSYRIKRLAKEEFIKSLEKINKVSNGDEFYIKSIGDSLVSGVKNNFIDKELGQEKDFESIFNDCFLMSHVFDRAFHLKSEASLVVYDTSNTEVNGDVLYQVFAPKNFWIIDEIKGAYESESFDYTNSTEMDVEPMEEMLRENVWKKVFEESSYPSEVGETIVFFDVVEYLKNNPKIAIQKISEQLVNSFNEVDFKSMEQVMIVNMKVAVDETYVKSKKNISDYMQANRAVTKLYKEGKLQLSEKDNEYISKKQEQLQKLKQLFVDNIDLIEKILTSHIEKVIIDTELDRKRDAEIFKNNEKEDKRKIRRLTM